MSRVCFRERANLLGGKRDASTYRDIGVDSVNENEYLRLAGLDRRQLFHRYFPLPLFEITRVTSGNLIDTMDVTSARVVDA